MGWEKSDSYRELYEKSPLSYQSLNSEGCFIDINPAWIKTFGYSREEVLGRKFSEFMTRASGALVPERFPVLKKVGEVRDADFEMIHKDGQVISVMLHGTSSYDEDGNFLHTHCFLVDVTEARRTGKLLRESEAENRLLTLQYNTLLGSVTDRITLLDPQLRIVWTNHKVGLDGEEFCVTPEGQHCYEILRKRESACDECPAVKCFQTQQPVQHERVSDSGKVTLLRAFPVLDDRGNVVNVVEIGQDVTEKVSLQKEFVRAGQLAALGELAAGVAHEINNPINGVINYAQLIKNRSDAESDIYGFAEGISKEGERVARIVKQLLFLAREDRSEFLDINIADPLSETLALVGTQFNSLGIELNVSLGEDLPQICGHAQQLEQLFLNLLSNARHALCKKFPNPNPNKRLEVKLGERNLDGQSFVVVTFHDFGIGIPMDLLDKVLQPFITSKPSSEGTGLGLSISNDIVRNHGGHLNIKSEEDKFTSVEVYIPAVVPG